MSREGGGRREEDNKWKAGRSLKILQYRKN
jgi:hypothetical protein